MMCVVPEIREILVTLAQRYAFREVSYLVGTGATGLALSQRDIARVQQMCAYGQRLFDLDAEDLAKADAATGASRWAGAATSASRRPPPNPTPWPRSVPPSGCCWR